jgi:hypothetical protein
MFLQWAEPTQEYGVFAIRGVIPYVPFEFTPASAVNNILNRFFSSSLLNGNIQASKTFITHFTAGLPPSFKLKSDSTILVGQQDEVRMTKDSLVNFSQMAVLTCQRAQGDQSKVMRECWVRLSGTYQSKVGLLSSPGMRKVSDEAV